MIDHHKIKIGNWIQVSSPLEDCCFICQLQSVYQINVKPNQNEKHELKLYWIDVNISKLEEINDAGHFRLKPSHRSIIPFSQLDFIVDRRVYVYNHNEEFFMNIHLDSRLRTETRFPYRFET